MSLRIPTLLLAALTLAAPVAAAEPLTLDEALALAAERNETSAVAAARLERAEALRMQAVSALVPTLTLTGAYTRRPREITRTIDGDEVTVQAIDALSGQFDARATLFDLRALPLLRAATRGVEAQRLESRELERALAHDVASGFYLTLGAEQLLAAATERVRAAEATLEESRLRVEAGLAGRNDATRTELELASARLEETRAASDARTARLSLGFLIDADLAGRPLVEPDDPPVPEGGVDEMTGRAVASRADLAALEERARQTRFFASAPRLGILPRFDVRGLYRGTNETGLSGRSEDWNVTVGLTWELFDGGNRSALAAQRDAEADEAELVAARMRRQIGLEIAQAIADLESADAAVEQAAVRLEVAQANAFEVRERYSNGLATALEQTDAAVEQFEAEATLVRQRYSRALTRLALGRGLGLWPGSAPSDDPSPIAEEPTP